MARKKKERIEDPIPAYLQRPFPPPYSENVFMQPADELISWLHAMFIAPDAPFENPDHRHLQWAKIGILWSYVGYVRRGRQILGTAELALPSERGWARVRARQQLAEWFEFQPDFLITFDAAWAARATDAEFCYVAEHELYHCGHDRDAKGAPRFNRDGAPIFKIRDHDVQEFVGVVERYGAIKEDVARLVDAAKKPPIIDAGRLSGVCGTCFSKAA